MYTVISDKLVGMLLRARKHKIVDFEGEVLFQVSITHYSTLQKNVTDARLKNVRNLLTPRPNQEKSLLRLANAAYPHKISRCRQQNLPENDLVYACNARSFINEMATELYVK